MKKRVGYFQLQGADWVLVNEAMPGLRDLGVGTDVPIGRHVKLAEGAKILLSPDERGRLILVHMAGNPAG